MKINRVIGYYEAWSGTERSCYGMSPETIPFGVYTHIKFEPVPSSVAMVNLLTITALRLPRSIR
jgi:hypothetical protein